MTRTALTCLIVILALGSPAAAQTYTIEIFTATPALWEINPATGATTSMVPLTGFVGNGFTGLAINPVTGVFYGIDGAGSVNRALVSINPSTGVVTTVGQTGRPLADLAFAQDGTLYAIEGTRLGAVGALYTVDTTTAVPTLVANLGSSFAFSGGLAVSPYDGLIYRMDAGLLSSYDPNAGFAQTLIGGTPTFEYSGLCFDIGGDLLGLRYGTMDVISPLTGAVSASINLSSNLSGAIEQLVIGPSFPGTQEDLVTLAAVNFSAFTTVNEPSNDIISLMTGDTISIRHISPLGTFNFLQLEAFGSLAPIGTPSFSPFPGLHLLTGGGIYAINGGIAGVPPILPPSGVTYAGRHVGPTLSGVSTLIQAVSVTGTAANNIFASTNGLLIQFL